jgi:hypothetical protein
MTTATKGVQADAGSGGSLGGGLLRLRCRVICDLDSLDGYQQLCRSVVVSKGAHGVFPVDGVLQLYGDGGRGGVCSSLSPAGTHCLAPQTFRLVHMVFMGSRWSYTCNFVMRIVPTVGESHNKKFDSISDYE